MLTDVEIRNLANPITRKEIPAGKVAGLYLVLQPSGKKSWALRFRLHGAPKKLTLGDYPDLSLAAARRKAEQARGDLAKGNDPSEAKKAARAAAKAKREAVTLAALIEDWKALHLAEKRASYSREAVRALRYAFDKQLSAPAAALDRDAVVRVLDGITKAGKKAIAGRTAAYGRACYQWAMKRGSLTANPFVNLPRASVVKRERVLTDDELRAIWNATGGEGSYNAIVRMLILTGQRREEVAGMAWSELADDLSVWTIPSQRAKNKAAHIVPLALQAQIIVRAASRIEGQPLVFPGTRGPFNGFSKAKDALDKASGVKNWRLHDLRRSMATNLQKLGVRLEVTEAVLNHVSGSRAGIVGVYQRHEYAAEKRQALDAWARRLDAIVKGGAGSNVVELAKARG